MRVSRLTVYSFKNYTKHIPSDVNFKILKSAESKEIYLYRRHNLIK